MRVLVLLVCLSVGLAGATAGTLAADPEAQSPAATAVAEYSSLVGQYCATTCHSNRLRAGGLSLEGQDLTKAAENGQLWERVIRKLRVGAMPPQGAPRPEQVRLDGMAAWLEETLDAAAAARPNPGAPVLHRLNRTEYANAIRDLLSVDLGDAARLLPPDDSAFGFDNVAHALSISPALLEGYLSAAGRISVIAVGDGDASAGAETYYLRQDLSQDRHIEGLSLGTVGGMVIRHMFPRDGEYLFQTTLFRTNTDAMRGLDYPHQLEIALDGERIYLGSVGGEADLLTLFADPKPGSDSIDQRLRVSVPVPAGYHDVQVAFVEKTHAKDTHRLKSFIRSSSDTFSFSGRPHIESLTITGPYNAGGIGATQSRERVFVCRPGRESEEIACARRILSTLGRRAFRRPLSKADLDVLVDFYRVGRAEGGFEAGIQVALQRMLASPQFVFRFERAPESLAPGAVHRLDEWELASRLSFFLWSSIPDDELLDAAARGTLSDPGMLQQQARRLLADTRAEALVKNFAGQWLQLRNLRNIVPNSLDFPDFDDNLRQAFVREAELFVQSVVREDRSVLDLLTADYTFVNERLARHYGIQGVYGSHFRRVPLAQDARRGLLGKGAILTVTSHADRTAPVLRGKWVMENLMGVPPPPPPPVVPPLDEEGGGRRRTMRERMELHRQSPACASCHRLMDPLGLALENFDAVGAWRTRDAGSPIDAATDLFDGSQVDGPVQLRQALLKRPNVFVGTLAEKLLTYALGRGLTETDMPAVRQVVRAASRKGYTFSSVIEGIVASPQFRMRTRPADVQKAVLETATRE